MAEGYPVSPPSIATELDSALELNIEKRLTQTNDFRHLQMDFHDIIDAHPSAGPYQGHPTVSSSVYLRQAGESEDAPRFRVVTDPSGYLNQANKFRDDPTLILRLEQGQRHGDHPARGKTGSWLMEVAVMLSRVGQVWVVATGSQKTGRRTREPLPGSSPRERLANEEFVDWIKKQIGDPETLVPAPTKAELKGAKFLGGIGLRLPHRK